MVINDLFDAIRKSINLFSDEIGAQWLQKQMQESIISKRTRREFSPDTKAAIVRRHLFNKGPIPDLCDAYSIQPSLFYQWQHQVMGNLEAAFSLTTKVDEKRSRKLEQKIEKLEAKIARKDNVTAEISEAYVALKKELGEL